MNNNNKIHKFIVIENKKNKREVEAEEGRTAYIGKSTDSGAVVVVFLIIFSLFYLAFAGGLLAGGVILIRLSGEHIHERGTLIGIGIFAFVLSIGFWLLLSRHLILWIKRENRVRKILKNETRQTAKIIEFKKGRVFMNGSGRDGVNRVDMCGLVYEYQSASNQIIRVTTTLSKAGSFLEGYVEFEILLGSDDVINLIVMQK